jgi:hypothetical protein
MTQETTTQGNIRNCPWGFKCEKTWAGLIATDTENIRFCDACDKEVHLCDTKEELADSVLLNRCVAVPAALLYSRFGQSGENQEQQGLGDSDNFLIGMVKVDYLKE